MDYRARDGLRGPPRDIYDTTAVARSDYAATSGMLSFQPGETLKTVEIDVLARQRP